MPSDAEIQRLLGSKFSPLRNRWPVDQSLRSSPPIQKPLPEAIDTLTAQKTLDMTIFQSVETTLIDVARQMLDLADRET